jgi:hypothetical protein
MRYSYAELPSRFKEGDEIDCLFDHVSGCFEALVVIMRHPVRGTL